MNQNQKDIMAAFYNCLYKICIEEQNDVEFRKALEQLKIFDTDALAAYNSQTGWNAIYSKKKLT